MNTRRVVRTWGTSEQKIVAAAQQWKCLSCNELLPPSFELDHVTPLWKGGSNDLSNAAALCGTCHNSKTQREGIERRRLRAEERSKAVAEAVAHARETERKRAAEAAIAAAAELEAAPRETVSAPVPLDPLLHNNPFLEFAFVPKQ